MVLRMKLASSLKLCTTCRTNTRLELMSSFCFEKVLLLVHIWTTKIWRAFLLLIGSTSRNLLSLMDDN